MTEFISAPTPMGRLNVALAVDGVRLSGVPQRTRRFANEVTHDWHVRGAATVTCTVVPMAIEDFGYDQLGVPVGAEGAWGIVAGFTAHAECESLEMRTYFNASLNSGWDSGEGLAARRFVAGELGLYLGGGDDEFLLRRVESGLLPLHWLGRIGTGETSPRFGVSDWLGPEFATQASLGTGSNGLGWFLPGIHSGEHVDLHCAVAWGRGEFGQYSANSVVDTSPERILSHSFFYPAPIE